MMIFYAFARMKPGLVVVKSPDVERDDREIGSGRVEYDARIFSEFTDEECNKAPEFIGDCILSLIFDRADAGKERSNARIVRGSGLELLRHILRVGKSARIRTSTSLANGCDGFRILEVESPDTGESKSALCPVKTNAPAPISDRLMGIWPAVWAPSTMRKISFDAQYSATGRTFCKVPSTLLP